MGNRTESKKKLLTSILTSQILSYNTIQLSCRLPFAIYLKSVWSLDVHESSVDKLAHSHKDSADD